MTTKKDTAVPGIRHNHRVPADLETIVRVKESAEETWKEITSVSTVSRNGAGFTLSRPVVVGRLVALLMPLEPSLRAYDKKEENYPVMGLIQYCNEGLVDDEKVYHVGVGFVGRTVPESYKADPRQSYHICGMDEEGLWKIAESAAQFKARKSPRFNVEMEVSLLLIKKGKKGEAKRHDLREITVTRNMSATGASVFSRLEAEIGDKVKFGSKEHNFFTIAVVRNRDESPYTGTTLHLEFIDSQFPMEKIYCGQMDVKPEETDPVEMEVEMAVDPPDVPADLLAEAFEFSRF